MKMAIYTDSRPNKPYTGQVGYISPRAEFTPKNVETPELRTSLVYRLRVVVDRRRRRTAPGNASDSPAGVALTPGCLCHVGHHRSSQRGEEDVSAGAATGA